MEIRQAPVEFVTRYSHYSFIFENRLYIYGGFNSEQEKCHDIVFIDLNDYIITQVKIQSEDSPDRGDHFAYAVEDRLIVAVVNGNGDIPTGVWTLHLPSLRWRHHGVTRILDAATWHYMACSKDGSKLWLIGNEDKDSEDYLETVTVIDLESIGIISIPPSTVGTDFAQLLGSKEYSDFTILSADQNASAIPAQYVEI